MITIDKLNKIRHLIRRGKIEGALNAFSKLLLEEIPEAEQDSMQEFSDELIQLSSQYFIGKKQDDGNLGDFKNFQQLTNQLVKSLLVLCNRLQEFLSEKMGDEDKPATALLTLFCPTCQLEQAKHIQELVASYYQLKIVEV
ncbi:MAG: hypothetical protein AAFY71_00725 [Bacteroidota bacterium]